MPPAKSLFSHPSTARCLCPTPSSPFSIHTSCSLCHVRSGSVTLATTCNTALLGWWGPKESAGRGWGSGGVARSREGRAYTAAGYRSCSNLLLQEPCLPVYAVAKRSCKLQLLVSDSEERGLVDCVTGPEVKQLRQISAALGRVTEEGRWGPEWPSRFGSQKWMPHPASLRNSLLRTPHLLSSQQIPASSPGIAPGSF